MLGFGKKYSCMLPGVADVVGFTRLSAEMPTADVFTLLSKLYTAFDHLTERYMVYKAETIGKFCCSVPSEFMC
jgi:hypothetical protein